MSALAIVDLTGKTAVVTGGARGIGREVAGALAQAGGAIADIAPVDETLPAVTALGRPGVASELDVSRPDEVAQFADLVRLNFSKFAITVHPIAPGLFHWRSNENDPSP